MPIPARCVAALALLLLASPARALDTSRTLERTVTQLAPGVWEIRHADPVPGWVHGNTLVVIGTQGVFVVDACNIAWDAQTDIAQIREWTDLPVRWVLNTHWHQDHNGGNHEYLQAFPGATILATSETKRRMDATSATVPAQILADAGKSRSELEQALASGIGRDGQVLGEAGVARTRQSLADLARVVDGARHWVYQAPTCTFDDALTLDLGGREVQVKWLGRGNTGGDAIAWLPQEKILATGDLVVHPVPFTFDGYPKEWVATLDRLAALGAQTIVPGHGEVLHGNTYVLQLRDLFASIVGQVEAELDLDSESSLEAVKDRVDIRGLRAAILGDDTVDAGFFDYAMGSFIGFTYHEAKQR